MTSSATADAGPSAVGWRFKLGIGLFASAFLLWLLVPLAAALGMPIARIAGLTGTVFVANKLLLLAVVGVLGESGFQQLKRMLFGYVSGFAPEASVSPVRYQVGLIMFCLPLVSAWLEPYVDVLAPGLRPNLWQLQLLGDLIFAASFFVLGGNFWAKKGRSSSAQRWPSNLREYRSGFAAALVLKDLRLAEQAGLEAGLPLPLCQAGNGDLDCSAIIRMIEGS